MAKIKFTDQSISDLEDIANYISIDSKYYASLQLEKLFRRADTRKISTYWPSGS